LVCHAGFIPGFIRQDCFPARLILQLANQKQLSLEPNRIFPKFEPGESVKIPPKPSV
jgi:hypothetical protein